MWTRGDHLSQILDLSTFGAVMEVLMRGKGGSCGASVNIGWLPHAISTWMQGWLPDAGDAERETLIQGLYGLWCARNEARDGKRIPDPCAVAERVHDHMQEWRSVHDRTAVIKDSRSRNSLALQASRARMDQNQC